LLVVYAGLAITHAHTVPMGATGYQNAPDEAAHLRYVQSIAEGHLPTRASSANDPLGYEWHQPPLYYAYAALFRPFGAQAVRYASILCGLAGILLVYLAARQLFPSDPLLAAVAAGMAALTPTHIAITSTVGNDALLEVCFSGALLVLVCALHGGFTLWRAGWLGVAIGGAILTKATGVLLLPVLVAGLFLLYRNGEKPAAIWKGAAWSLLLALAVCGWWLVRNALLYGELLPLRAFAQAFGGTRQAADVAAQMGGWGAYAQQAALWSYQSFWAVYGTPETAKLGVPVFLPAQFYWIIGLVNLAAVGGLVRAHFHRAEFTQAQRAGIYLLFLTLALVALSFGAFLRQYFQVQGRYLYPAMLAIAVLFALGWRRVIPERYGGLSVGLLLTFLGALAVIFLRYAQFAVG
jgi:4-amino-4-deoxy-L-arabinose transferase-like glycosyltransferase